MLGLLPPQCRKEWLVGAGTVFVMFGAGCFQWISGEIGWNEENKILQDAIVMPSGASDIAPSSLRLHEFLQQGLGRCGLQRRAAGEGRDERRRGGDLVPIQN